MAQTMASNWFCKCYEKNVLKEPSLKEADCWSDNELAGVKIIMIIHPRLRLSNNKTLLKCINEGKLKDLNALQVYKEQFSSIQVPFSWRYSLEFKMLITISIGLMKIV